MSLPDKLISLLENTQPNDLLTLCDEYKDICRDNFDNVAKFYLDKYQVDYQDPTNF